MQLVDAALQQVLDGRRRLDSSLTDRRQQRFNLVAQVAHGRYTGHARAAFQRVQMPSQLVHWLCRTLLDPLLQRLVRGLEELCRLLGKNRRDFRIVAGLFVRLFVVPRGCGTECRLRCGRLRFFSIGRLYRLAQIIEVLDQWTIVVALALRIVDIADNRVDRCDCIAKRVDSRLIETGLVIVCPSHEPVQRRSDGNPAFYVRHVGAAMQCMARTVQLVGYGKRRLVLGARVDIVGNRFQVTRRFLGEDIVENRVHFRRRFFFDRRLRGDGPDGQRGCVRIAFCKSVRARDQQVDIRLWFAADLQLLDQFGHRLRSLQNKIDHRRSALERAVDQAIQQVFNRPAILPDALGAHHAAAAFQRMERAAHGYQPFDVVRHIGPVRQAPPDRRNLFLGLLDKQLE